MKRLIYLLIVIIYSKVSFSKNEDTAKIIYKIFLIAEIQPYSDFLISNDRKSIVIFKNKTFHKMETADSAISKKIKLLDDGWIYYYDIDYFVVFDEFQVIGKDSCKINLHTTSRFRSERNKDQKYFKLEVLMIQINGLWEVHRSHLKPYDCCNWKIERD